MIFLGTKDELHERLEETLVKGIKYPAKDGIMHQLNTVTNYKSLTIEDLQRAMVEISSLQKWSCNWTTYATTGTIISDRPYITATSATQAHYIDSNIVDV